MGREGRRRLHEREPVNRAGRRLLRAGLRGGRRIARRWRVAGVVTVEVEGFSFRMLGRCDDLCLDALWFGHPWARGELRLFAALAGRARTVLDLGANTGVFTLLAAAAGAPARLVAVEPHPGNAERLRANIGLNGLEGRVLVVEQAVGDAEATASLDVPADRALSDVASVVPGFTRAHHDGGCRSIEVDGTTVDNLGLTEVDLVKLDVEGHELAALRGARGTLELRSPAVLAEVFNTDVLAAEMPELADRLPQDNASGVEALMSELGYTAYAVGENGVVRVPDLRGLPNAASNFLFSTAGLDGYTPYSDTRAIERLLPGP